MQFVYESQNYLEENISAENLIKISPYGVSLTSDAGRPLLLLKSENSEETLPVLLNPLEAGVTLSQSNRSMLPSTPHKFTELLLSSLDIKIEKAVFIEIKGHYQYLLLIIQGHPQMTSLKIRADEVMSLCTHLKVPLYCTKEFLARSKVMSLEMDGLEKGLKTQQGVLQKNHHYLM